MSSGESKERKTVRRRVLTGTNPEGKKMYGWKTFDAGAPPTESELPSLDGSGEETRVEGLPGDPVMLGNRTAEEIERSRRGSRVVSGVEKSLPKGDRD